MRKIQDVFLLFKMQVRVEIVAHLTSVLLRKIALMRKIEYKSITQTCISNTVKFVTTEKNGTCMLVALKQTEASPKHFFSNRSHGSRTGFLM